MIIGGRDTRPNLSSSFFEQYTGTTLTLSGNTVIEINGNFNNRSKNGYQISGATFLNSGNALHQLIIGSGATVGGACSIAVGFNSNAQCIGATSLGACSESKGNFGVDIGFRTGSGTGTKGLSHIAIGHNTAYNSSIGACSISIGKSISNSGANSIAIGTYSTSNNNNNIAIGKGAYSLGCNTIAFGPDAKNSESCSILIAAGTGGTLMKLSQPGDGFFLADDLKLGFATNSPNARIDILATGATEGFRLRTNNEGIDKVLTSDASGYGDWVDIDTVIPESTTDRVVNDINQSSHGFSVGEILTWSGGTYLKSIADGTQNGEIIGVVSEVTDANNFKLTQSGWITGLTGLVTNSTYYVSDITAGATTTSEPTTQGNISRPIFIAISSTEAIVFPYRGRLITDLVETTTFNSYTATTDSRISTNETNISSNDADIDFLSGQTSGITENTVDIFAVPATEQTKLSNEANWNDVDFTYTGTSITGTSAGQFYNDTKYLFFAVADNNFIRLPRV